jgi:Domain of unknown function (DUF4112)/Sulfotransferase family
MKGKSIPGAEAPETAPVQVANMGNIAPDVLDRLVYLVGSPRGGTSIIKNSFFLSDRVFSLPTMTLFTNRVWRYRKRLNRHLLRQSFERPKFYRKDAVLTFLEEPARAHLERRMQDAFAQQHLGRMYQLYPLLYALDPDCHKDARRALCWADKANDVYGLFDIPRYLPKSKFILIARDPRATVASMQRQTLMSRAIPATPQETLAALVESCLYWRHMMQSCLRFSRRHPDRSLFIFYEEFVHDAEKAINRLHDFAVGERMPEDALRAGLSQFSHKRKHDRSAHGFGIDTRPLERWRRMLQPEELDVAVALTWRTARKLGYDIAPPEGSFTALRAVARLGGWRCRAIAAAKLVYLEVMEGLTPALPASRNAQVIGGLRVGLTHAERLKRVQQIAWVMDDQFAVPGINLRFGLDSIVGLIPGVGDLVTGAISLVIVRHAWQTGMSRPALARMLGNIGLDVLIGAVPLVGDAFDVVWKANRKNAYLLERHLAGRAAEAV